MSITRRLRSTARLCALTCALLAPAATAAAAPDPLAQERYYQSYPTEGPTSAQEQYYSSYGEPEPRTPNPSDDASWIPVALSIVGALAVAAVSATQVRRVRVRRRRAAHTAA